MTKKVNELIEAEKEQQLAYDRQRNLLLSDIAHDIKTPITTLCSYSKALSDGVVQGEKRQEYLDAIYAKSMRMGELIIWGNCCGNVRLYCTLILKTTG